MMKTRDTFLAIILLILGCSRLASDARAVSPAPDGGYPGGNTAEGQDALLSLNVNAGSFNTAVGWLSLKSNIEGDLNTAFGSGTLTANTGYGNTAIGGAALFSNSTGSGNTAVGLVALYHNTTGYDNVANGYNALFSNREGIGNMATGTFALLNNTTGSDNTASGTAALINNQGGNSNTATGVQALFNNATGSNNTAIGTNALVNSTTGSNNIAVGFGAGANVHTASDTICIGAAGVDATDGCYIGHVFEEPLDPDNLTMAIDVHGKVGTLASSRRFKKDIKPMDKASEAILALKPVTFHYKNDAKCSPRFGLIAEEVATVDPNLVALDKAGKPYSVRYDQVNAMLLNEFLKEHKKAKEQHATIAGLRSTVAQQRKDFQIIADKLQKGIRALTAHLKQQGAQIQKVSGQVELNKPALQLAATTLNTK